MRAFIIRGLLQSLIVLWIVLLIVFLMLHMTGDPADVMMPEEATLDEVAAFNKEMGFDKPIYVQYFNFLFGNGKNLGVLRGDFGNSFYHGVPAMGIVTERIPATVILSVVALFVALVLAIPMGILSAVFRKTWIDHFSSVLSMAGQSSKTSWKRTMST